jgi:hypothetical protein
LCPDPAKHHVRTKNTYIRFIDSVSLPPFVLKAGLPVFSCAYVCACPNAFTQSEILNHSYDNIRFLRDSSRG